MKFVREREITYNTRKGMLFEVLAGWGRKGV